MELTIDKRKKEINIIHNLGLSYWDMLYWQNNSILCNDLKNLKNDLNVDIQNKLNNLYAIAENEGYFAIDSKNNMALDRYFNGVLENVKKNGSLFEYADMVTNIDYEKEDLAKKFASRCFEEYKHLVHMIKEADYTDSFKCLVLNEALTKEYKTGEKLSIANRKNGKSIAGIINFAVDELDFIYNNVENYDNFGQLYIEAQAKYQQKLLSIANSGSVNIDINTFNKGRWIKFDSKSNNVDDFEDNVSRLKTLVADTNWCTSTLASQHLSEGDFYVFVDNSNEPRIAVKMTGDSIEEVRGRANGFGQELEEEYRDVAIEFLENNKDICNGKEWLKKEEWNKKLTKYLHDIDSGEFLSTEVPNLLVTLFQKDYRIHGVRNMNVVQIQNKLPLIKKQIAEYYGYKEDEVWVGEWFVGITKVPENVKMVIGDVKFSCIVKGQSYYEKARDENRRKAHSQFLNVERLIGNADFMAADFEELTNLKEAYGNLIMSSSKIKHLGVLTNVYGNLGLANTPIESLGDLVYVSKQMDLTNTNLLSLGKLKRVGESLILLKSELPDTGELEEIGGSLNASVSKLKKLIKVKKIGNTLNAINCELEDLGELEFVGNINLSGTKLTTLNNVKEVLYNLDADKNIKSLGKLEKVGDKLDISRTGITKLDKIKVGNELVVSKYNLVDITDVDANKVIVFDNKGRCDTVMDKESYVSMASNCLTFV